MTNKKNLQTSIWTLAAAGLVTGLSGCGKPATVPEEIRPVRTVVVQAAPVDFDNTYAGEVRPRYESTLGFRVAGKILERRVNIGDTVKAGDVLARLDQKDLSLSEASSKANVAAQEASFEIEKADLARDKDLQAQGFISHSDYERQMSKFQAAQAQLEALRASYRVSANQTGYADLRADHDGVISSISAEAGQVVAAGAPVVMLAWSGTKEIAANVPEDQIRRLQSGMPALVTLWADASKKYPGVIREVSSSADPSTRTYSLRVTVPDAPEQMRLGMTASVRIPVIGAPKLVRLPLTALIERGGKKGFWVFDEKTGTVNFREAAYVGASGNDVLIAGGLADGERVVTAGAPLLRAGQKVKLMETGRVTAG